MSAIRCGSCGGFGFLEQCGALAVGGEHHLDQAFGSARRFLREAADAPARWNGDLAALGCKVAANGLKQRRFSSSVAADQADARPWRDLHAGVVDQQPSGDPERDVGDGEHAAFSPERPPNATHLSVKSGSPDAALMQVVVAAAQFIHQLLQMGRELGFRTHVLLQPFADGIADRSRRSGDQFASNSRIDSAIHNEFQHRF